MNIGDSFQLVPGHYVIRVFGIYQNEIETLIDNFFLAIKIRIRKHGPDFRRAILKDLVEPIPEFRLHTAAAVGLCYRIFIKISHLFHPNAKKTLKHLFLSCSVHLFLSDFVTTLQYETFNFALLKSNKHATSLCKYLSYDPSGCQALRISSNARPKPAFHIKQIFMNAAGTFFSVRPNLGRALKTGVVAGLLLQITPHVLPGRSLNQAETDLLNDFFGPALHTGAITIAPPAASNMIEAVKSPGEGLEFLGSSFGNRIFGANFFDGDYNRLLEYALIHEAAHVYQHQNGMVSTLSLIFGQTNDMRTSRNDEYKYTLAEGWKFEEYGHEQQASILADYFRMTRQQADPFELYGPNRNIPRPELIERYNQILDGIIPLIHPVIRSDSSDPDVSNRLIR